MRIKFRYLICRLTAETYKEYDIYEAIRLCVREMYGLIGEGRLMNRFKVVYCNDQTKLVVIRVLSETKTRFLYCLTMMKKIKDKAAVFDVVGLSGSQRGTQKQIVNCYTKMFS